MTGDEKFQELQELKKYDQEFLELLQQISVRPAMYVGKTDLQRISNLMWGYGWGFTHGRGRRSSFVAAGSPLDGFSCFVRLKFVIDHPAWGFERILLHEYEHDHAKAIAALPVLFEEFISKKYDEKISVFAPAFSKKLHEAIVNKYGADPLNSTRACGAPDCKECESFSD